MNIIRKINRNLFLTKLFPNGITEPVYLGQIRFSEEGRLNLNIHIKQKPFIEIEKWGTWGSDYNVIVVKLNGICRGSSTIRNWENADYAHLTIIDIDNTNTFTISQMCSNWSIEIECLLLVFHKCSTYYENS